MSRVSACGLTATLLCLSAGCGSQSPTSLDLPALPSPPAAAAPAITTQPSGQTIGSGQTVVLSVIATGDAPLAYQWYSGASGVTASPLAGATTPSYTTPALTTSTSYWVRVSNAYGTADSAAAAITVQPDASVLPAEDAVLLLVNQQRAAGAICGGTSFPSVAPLTMNAQLRAAARAHSEDMAALGYLSHTSLDGRTVTQRIRSAGYMASPIAENIAAGYPTAESVVAGWMASPGHCSNIMSGGFRSIGVGYAFLAGSPFGHYWTQDFGGS